jgi:hypothetical protein
MSRIIKMSTPKTRPVRPGLAVVRQTAGISPISQWFTLDRFWACA